MVILLADGRILSHDWPWRNSQTIYLHRPADDWRCSIHHSSPDAYTKISPFFLSIYALFYAQRKFRQHACSIFGSIVTWSFGRLSGGVEGWFKRSHVGQFQIGQKVGTEGTVMRGKVAVQANMCLFLPSVAERQKYEVKLSDTILTFWIRLRADRSNYCNCFGFLPWRKCGSLIY